MKKILIVGCSYSAKAENDEYISYGEYCEKDGYEVDNFSVHGASNILIRRILQTQLAKNKYDFVLVQWSTIDRWDYPKYENNILKYHPYGSNIDLYKKEFYINYYSVYGAIMDTLDNILLAQKIIESYNIPYKMITIGNLFEMEASVEAMQKLGGLGGDYSSLRVTNLLDITEKNTKNDDLLSILELIDFNKFKFSTFTDKYFGGGMIEFLLNKNDYPKFKYHYTSEQHNLFYNEFIKEILK